MTLTLVRK